MSTTDRVPPMMLDHAYALLEKNPARGVSAEDLARVLASAEMRKMSQGEVLCSEGEPGDALFFLLDGSIRVTRTDPHGRERELARIDAPSLVGHMALIDNSPRSATCIANDRTVVARLDRKMWTRVLHEPSERGTALRRILCASLTRQLVGANEQIRTMLAPRPAAPSAVSRDRGHVLPTTPAVPVSAALDAVDDFDASDSELMQVAGVLDGWKIDKSSLKTASKDLHVFDEDQVRNRKNRF